MPPRPPRRPWMDLSPAGRVGGEKSSPSLERPPDGVASPGAYSALTSLADNITGHTNLNRQAPLLSFLWQKRIFSFHSLSTAISRDKSHLVAQFENKSSSAQRPPHTVRPRQHSSESAGQTIILCEHFDLSIFFANHLVASRRIFERTHILDQNLIFKFSQRQSPKKGLGSGVAFISFLSRSLPLFN